MAKKTTLKPVMLSYRAVGGTGTYIDVSGVLKGLTITQDEPEATEIEAEFFDSPFYIEYSGNPVTINFELANYDLSELVALIGGSVTDNKYEAATAAFTTEKEWKLDFQVGNASLVIYRGLAQATLKKDEDGALNYAFTITSLVYTDDNDVNHLYRIDGSN